MDDSADRVRELIAPLFSEGETHLVEVRLRGAPGSRVLHVTADTEQGISLDEITRLTREIGGVLDEYPNLIRGGYRLEVSSPGVDRPLEHDWEFRKNLSRELKVVYNMDGGEHKVTGTLVAVDAERIIIRRGKGDVNIPRPAIRSARVQLKW